MKPRRTLTVAVVALLGTAVLTTSERVHIGQDAAGPRDTVVREIPAVSTVEIGTSGVMRVSVGDEPSLTITAGERVLDELTAVVHGDRLEIDLPGAWINVGRIDYELVVPALASVVIEGSATVTGELAPAGAPVEVRVQGSGDVDLDGAAGSSVLVVVDGSGDVTLDDVDTPTAEVAIDGAGDVALRGTADTLAVSIPGSGDVDTSDLVAQDVTASVQGSGTIRVRAERTLDARIDGSGDITYLGDPEVTSDVDGSGDIGRA